MGACNRLVIFKLIELAITGGCIALHWFSLETYNQNYKLAITAILGGYAIVLVGAILATIVQDPIGKRAWIVYCILGLLGFGAVGALAIHYQLEDTVQSNINKATDYANKVFGNDQLIKDDTKTYGLAKGALAITNAFVFFLDFIFTFRYKPE